MTNAIENFICSKCNKIIKNGQICFLYEGEKLFCVKCYFQVLNTEKQNCDDKLKYLKEEINNNCVDGKDYNNLKQQLEEKNKEIERLRKNHRISYTNQKKAYENLKNSVNAKSLIKYPIRLDGCLIKDEQDLFDYAKESTRDIKYLRNERTQLAIQELEKVKIMAENLLEKFCSSWEYHQKYMRGHRHIEYYDLIQGIDNQIKELKGE